MPQKTTHSLNDVRIAWLQIDTDLRLLYDGDEVACWWNRPHPQLNGDSAIHALLSGHVDAVRRAVPQDQIAT